MQNDNYSDIVKDKLLKQLSQLTRYGCFINIAEEPELSLFPKTQMDVLFSLIKSNAMLPDNMLVITTHSPYTLAILNLMAMACKVAVGADDEIRAQVDELVAPEYRILPQELSVFRLSETEEPYCRTIVSDKTGLISKNDLDSVSEEIMRRFNALYRLYEKKLK